MQLDINLKLQLARTINKSDQWKWKLDGASASASVEVEVEVEIAHWRGVASALWRIRAPVAQAARQFGTQKAFCKFNLN